jgi:hypothetical protein
MLSYLIVGLIISLLCVITLYKADRYWGFGPLLAIFLVISLTWPFVVFVLFILTVISGCELMDKRFKRGRWANPEFWTYDTTVLGRFIKGL